MSESFEEISKAFVTYYQKLLGTKDYCKPIEKEVVNQGPLLAADMAEQLVKEVTDQEIKDALDGIGNDKAPGPDGYNSWFFKKSWSVTSPSVLAAVKEFFTTGQLLQQLNHTVLALIPKSHHATEVGDFRPIACCNVLYKLISKIIATRLAAVLDSIIDLAQSAFVEGRNISDNVHLAEGLLRQYERKITTPKCCLKVDLRKAYDSVDWGFLNDMLLGLGFPPLFTEWVMKCVSTTSYSLLAWK